MRIFLHPNIFRRNCRDRPIMNLGTRWKIGFIFFSVGKPFEIYFFLGKGLLKFILSWWMPFYIYLFLEEGLWIVFSQFLPGPSPIINGCPLRKKMFNILQLYHCLLVWQSHARDTPDFLKFSQYYNIVRNNLPKTSLHRKVWWILGPLVWIQLPGWP